MWQILAEALWRTYGIINMFKLKGAVWSIQIKIQIQGWKIPLQVTENPLTIGRVSWIKYIFIWLVPM